VKEIRGQIKLGNTDLNVREEGTLIQSSVFWTLYMVLSFIADVMPEIQCRSCGRYEAYSVGLSRCSIIYCFNFYMKLRLGNCNVLASSDRKLTGLNQWR
jgi:hypothetical protein